MSTDRVVGVVHVHSDYSHDGCDSLARLRAFAVERELSFIGLTDHAEDFDSARFEEYVRHCGALSDARVRLMPGLEYRFAGYTGLHLLALGVTRWISPPTPDAFIAEAPSAAALTILAHPVLASYHVPATVLEGIDAVEVWNAAYNTRYLPDPRAIRVLHAVRRSRPEIVGTVGLDQHDCSNDRETRVLVSAGETEPLRALKEGRFINAGRTMTFGPTVAWGPIRLGALSVARWALDRVERVHERIGHRVQARALRGAMER